MVKGETKKFGEERHRRIARVFGILGPALLMGYVLFRDALHVDAPLREGMDDSLWIIATPAILMIMYPSFLAGLIDGVPKEPEGIFPNKFGQRHSWTLIIVGALLCATAVLGWLLFERHAVKLGGLAGLMRSIAVPLSGAVLIGWGWARPAWLFLDDGDEPASQHRMPTATQ